MKKEPLLVVIQSSQREKNNVDAQYVHMYTTWFLLRNYFPIFEIDKLSTFTAILFLWIL